MTEASPERFTDYESAIATRDRLLPPNAIEKKLQALIELLPRELVGSALRPLENIRAIDSRTGLYLSGGDAPIFEIETAEFLSSGWYYLEVALTRNNGGRKAHLFFEYEDQRAHDRILIPSNLRGSVREVFFIPSGIKRLLWQPTTARGLFTQSPFVLHRISVTEAALRRWYRVLVDRWRFRTVGSSRSATVSIRHALYDLETVYRRSASLRVSYAADFDEQTLIKRSDSALREAYRAARRKKLDQSSVRIHILLLLQLEEQSLLSSLLHSLHAQSFGSWSLTVVPADQRAVAGLKRVYGNETKVRIFAPCPTGSREIQMWREVLNAELTADGSGLVGLISPELVLATESLLVIAAEAQNKPATNVFYFDEDRLDLTDGIRSSPLVRPDWNPDLLLSTPYLGDALFVRQSHFLSVGGWRPDFGEAHIYDLMLRATRELDSRQISHIPLILLHRVRANSANIRKSEQLLSALRSRLKGHSIMVTSTPHADVFRLQHPIRAPRPLVSIILPTRDMPELLASCVHSVMKKTTYPNWELIIADNDTTDPTALAWLQQFSRIPQIRVLRMPGPFNYSRINNSVARVAIGKVFVLLNNDTQVITPTWLEELVSHAVREGIGAVGAKLIYPDHSVQHGGVILGMGGIAGHAHRFVQHDAPGYMNRAVATQNVAAVTGACLAVQRDNFEAVGGLDEALAVAFNDIDFCLRLQERGLMNVFTPWAVLFHHESVTRGLDDTDAKRRLHLLERQYMEKRWGKTLKRDPLWGNAVP